MYCVPATTEGGLVNGKNFHPGPADTRVDASVAIRVPLVLHTVAVIVPVSSVVLYHQTPGKVPSHVTLILTPACTAYALPKAIVFGGVG